MSARVLQVVTSNDRRGAEVFALDLEAALRSNGVDVHTVALARGTTDALDLEILGRRSRAPATLRALRRRARAADLVVAHGGDTLSACGLALAGTRTPFVYRNIGDPVYWSASRRKRRQLRTLLRRPRAVVAIAEGAADALAGRFGVADERIRVIPTGVPAERFPPADARRRRLARSPFAVPDDASVVTVVAALTAEKDVALAVTAIGAWPSATLLVVGDGPERARLEEHAHATAPGRVRFTGWLDDPAPAYTAADAVVLTSRTEGLPGVLIEAGLSGVPAVTTDVGYVRDVVLDDATGYVVPRDATSIRGALERAVAARERRGAAARAHCFASFELDPVAGEWMKLLESLHR